MTRVENADRAMAAQPPPLLPLEDMEARVGVSFVQLVSEGLALLAREEAAAVFSRGHIELHEDLSRHHRVIAAEMTRLNFNRRYDAPWPVDDSVLSATLVMLHSLERSRLGQGPPVSDGFPLTDGRGGPVPAVHVR